jgi:enoyl-CoA hydratase/carnithine racemase
VVSASICSVTRIVPISAAIAAEAATERELVEQDWLRRTEDFKEGIKAYGERRLPNFQGR